MKAESTMGPGSGDETQGSSLLWVLGSEAPQIPLVTWRVGSYPVPVNQRESNLPSCLSKGIQEGEEARRSMTDEVGGSGLSVYRGLIGLESPTPICLFWGKPICFLETIRSPWCL